MLIYGKVHFSKNIRILFKPKGHFTYTPFNTIVYYFCYIEAWNKNLSLCASRFHMAFVGGCCTQCLLVEVEMVEANFQICGWLDLEHCHKLELSKFSMVSIMAHVTSSTSTSLVNWRLQNILF
jgi:hypothetical protein